MLFSHFSVLLTIVKNERPATNSKNAILNNFEEYYLYFVCEWRYWYSYVKVTGKKITVRLCQAQCDYANLGHALNWEM